MWGNNTTDPSLAFSKVNMPDITQKSPKKGLEEVVRYDDSLQLERLPIFHQPGSFNEGWK